MRLWSIGEDRECQKSNVIEAGRRRKRERVRYGREKGEDIRTRIRPRQGFERGTTGNQGAILIAREEPGIVVGVQTMYVFEGE